jgi:hypothetical protein
MIRQPQVRSCESSVLNLELPRRDSSKFVCSGARRSREALASSLSLVARAPATNLLGCANNEKAEADYETLPCRQ